MSIILLDSNSQSFKLSIIQIDSINKIDETNKSLVNPIIFPNIDENGIALNVASSEYYEFQQEEYVRRIVQEYITRNRITNNGYKSKRNAIIKKDSIFELNMVETEIRYYLDEGCYIQKHVAIIENKDINHTNIFCIFNTEKNLTPNQFTFFEIENNNNKYIEPKTEISFYDEKERLIFTYKGTYCYESFKYEDLGTTIPVYFNVLLSVKDLDTNNEEVILKMPHNSFFNIRKIYLADINSNKRKDIVIEVEDALCVFRLFYLTRIINGKTKYDYIGKMNVYCDCP